MSRSNSIASRQTSFLELIHEINEIVGVWVIAPRPENNDIPQEVQDLAKQRWEAKASKDFSKADEVRKQLADLGYVIKDSKDSYTIHKEE